MRDGLSQVYLKTCISPDLEIRLRQTQFSIYLVEQLFFYSIRFENLCASHRPTALGLLLVVSIKVIKPIQLLVGVSGT